MEDNKTGIESIAVERADQQKKGYTINHDVMFNKNDELITAVFGLINHKYGEMPDAWSDHAINKMLSKPYKERLVIAGALIAAEIDRLNYLENGR